jgi:hypothetical protein
MISEIYKENAGNYEQKYDEYLKRNKGHEPQQLTFFRHPTLSTITINHKMLLMGNRKPLSVRPPQGTLSHPTNASHTNGEGGDVVS